jgi:hypothetical protein
MAEEDQVLEEEVVEMDRENFVNMDDWIEHRFAPSHAIDTSRQQGPSNFRWTHEEREAPQSTVQPRQVEPDQHESGDMMDDSQDDLSFTLEEATRSIRRPRRTEHEQTVPLETADSQQVPIFIAGKSLFQDKGDSGEPLEEGGEEPVVVEEDPICDEAGFEVELPQADDDDESTLPYGGSAVEVQQDDIFDMQAKGVWGSYVKRCYEMDDSGQLKLIDPTRPATVLEQFRVRAVPPATRDTCVELMDGDMMNDEARVVILDVSADLNMKGWDVRTRFLWFHPGLEDYIWKMRPKPGTFFRVCGEVTNDKLVYVLTSRRRWTPQHGTPEIDLFITLAELFKEVREELGETEIAMTLPSIPSMGGRRLQIAQCVSVAARARGLHVRLYQSF